MDQTPHVMRRERVGSGAKPATNRRDRQPRQEKRKLAGTTDNYEAGEHGEIHPTDLKRDFKAPDRDAFRRSDLEVASGYEEQTYSPLDAITKTPPAGQPLLKTSLDRAMAARQPRYHNLSPKEQEKQMEWAQHQTTISENCPGNYPRIRYRSESQEKLKGLICLAHVHLMTDALLAEETGGMMMRGQNYSSAGKKFNKW
ncbi:uncharacterized protein PAC_01830 [Phialocephala subalpina]|uniref:Uncharacterized protein n=1 Tax=Phialocephala subalpina TaxID=576137 RepID=A0A1L7WGT9_9HELO|nr:uncharacterized protein PAC_01830 [Phialocephala subalpina]